MIGWLLMGNIEGIWLVSKEQTKSPLRSILAKMSQFSRRQPGAKALFKHCTFALIQKCKAVANKENLQPVFNQTKWRQHRFQSTGHSVTNRTDWNSSCQQIQHNWTLSSDWGSERLTMSLYSYFYSSFELKKKKSYVVIFPCRWVILVVTLTY